TSLGMNIYDNQENWYSGKDLRQLSADYDGEAWVRNTKTNYWQFENYITYTKEFNENHALTAMAGLGWQQYNYFTSRAGSRGFTDDFYEWNNIGVGANPITPESNTYKWAMNSYFAR